MTALHKSAARLTISAPSPALRGNQHRFAEAADGANLSKPWGNQPICGGCNRGATYSCICDPFPEDDDQMPAHDVLRIMGWELAERSAYGMPEA